MSRTSAPSPHPQGQLVGYARTSTAEQSAGLDAQRRDLEAVGCAKVFAEQVSSVAHRAALERALDYVREGDTLVVTKPDRLARSTIGLLALVDQLNAKGVALRILSMGGSAGPLDTSDPTAKLTLTLLAAVAEFERTIMIERQREGIAKAKADGRYQGRAPTAQRQAGKVIAMRAEGHKPGDIAEALGIGRASVFAILKQHREAASTVESA